MYVHRHDMLTVLLHSVQLRAWRIHCTISAQIGLVINQSRSRICYNYISFSSFPTLHSDSGSFFTAISNQLYLTVTPVILSGQWHSCLQLCLYDISHTKNPNCMKYTISHASNSDFMMSVTPATLTRWCQSRHQPPVWFHSPRQLSSRIIPVTATLFTTASSDKRETKLKRKFM